MHSLGKADLGLRGVLHRMVSVDRLSRLGLLCRKWDVSNPRALIRLEIWKCIPPESGDTPKYTSTPWTESDDATASVNCSGVYLYRPSATASV